VGAGTGRSVRLWGPELLYDDWIGPALDAIVVHLDRTAGSGWSGGDRSVPDRGHPSALDLT